MDKRQMVNWTYRETHRKTDSRRHSLNVATTAVIGHRVAIVAAVTATVVVCLPVGIIVIVVVGS